MKADVADITRKFDSIQFCVSKGLGAPVGSLIVGSREFIERCRPIRKMLGGGMRQAGVLAAAALVALEEGPERLWIDHENARFLAQGLAEIPGIRLDPAKVQTNIVIFGIEEVGNVFRGVSGGAAKRGVARAAGGCRRVFAWSRILHVDRAEIETAIAALRGYEETMSESKKTRVGVIFGGRSGEHEVSLRSAESVIRSLDPAKYEVVPIAHHA